MKGISVILSPQLLDSFLAGQSNLSRYRLQVHCQACWSLDMQLHFIHSSFTNADKSMGSQKLREQEKDLFYQSSLSVFLGFSIFLTLLPGWPILKIFLNLILNQQVEQITESIFKWEDRIFITLKDWKTTTPEVSAVLGVQIKGGHQQIDQVVHFMYNYFTGSKRKTCKIERKPEQYGNAERGSQERQTWKKTHLLFWKEHLKKIIFEAFLHETAIWLLEPEHGPEVIRNGGQRQHT